MNDSQPEITTEAPTDKPRQPQPQTQPQTPRNTPQQDNGALGHVLGDGDHAPSELEAEQKRVDEIVEQRQFQLDQMAERATKLAAEAAATTEDGLRDVFDEDDDADAAIAATFVRERSVHAMWAAKRFREAEELSDRAVFGWIARSENSEAIDGCDATSLSELDETSARALRVGRFSVFKDGEPLMVDWRARAAVPFYRATPMASLGLQQRRHLHYADASDAKGNTVAAEMQSEAANIENSAHNRTAEENSAKPNQLKGYSDEVFGDSTDLSLHGLRGEAALFAELQRDTSAQMRSVVATIQREQDEVIRAPSNEVVLVQGGPGTGKTVVALHRAAYLLYDQRDALAEQGVLIIGPTPQFLTYIAEVLPSLGETGVVSAMPHDLFGGVLIGHSEPEEVSSLKGSHGMVEVLQKAVIDRQRLPKEDLCVFYGSESATLSVESLQGIFESVKSFPTHNEAAQRFRALVIEALVQEVYEPAFHNYRDAWQSFASSKDLKKFLLKHWPPLRPTELLNDLLGSKALLKSAADKAGLSKRHRELLFRQRCSYGELDQRHWSEADVALLDELWALLGGPGEEVDDDVLQALQVASDEFEIAAAQDAEAPSSHAAAQALQSELLIETQSSETTRLTDDIPRPIKGTKSW